MKQKSILDHGWPAGLVESKDRSDAPRPNVGGVEDMTPPEMGMIPSDEAQVKQCVAPRNRGDALKQRVSLSRGGRGLQVS
jgi:hypothetical protein